MSDFQDYHSEDFLQEPSFCRYCLGVDASAVRFWDDWIRAHPEKAAAVKEAKELYYVLNGNITASTFAKERRRFEQAFQQHLQAPPVKTISPVWRILARAAVIALLINIAGFAVYQYKKQQRHRNYSSVAGERKSFQLPDGTSVMLNANSHITMASQFNKDTREVTLIGEAFFDVSTVANKPFIVHTSKMDIRVLGTSFNVRAYPEDNVVAAALIKGKVEVTIRGERNRKVILQAAQKITVPIVESHSARAQVVPIAKVALNPRDSAAVETSWTRNRLVMTDMPLGAAATEMSRWYGVKITVDSAIANKYRYTATFEKETVEQALKAMQASVPFHYNIVNNEIFISQ